jgi:hypothetical protein
MQSCRVTELELQSIECRGRVIEYRIQRQSYRVRVIECRYRAAEL